MKPEIEKLLEKADHALLVADDLLKNGYPADSASKSYYAMFYASQALLKFSGIEVIKHSAVEAALGFHFAKPGKISPELHRIFIDSRKIREIADYGIDEDILEPAATALIKKAVEFVSAIKALITE